MRTQQEILARFEKADDFFGTQQGDLISYMEFEFAKPFLKEDYVKKLRQVKKNGKCQQTQRKKF